MLTAKETIEAAEATDASQYISELETLVVRAYYQLQSVYMGCPSPLLERGEDGVRRSKEASDILRDIRRFLPLEDR